MKSSFQIEIDPASKRLFFPEERIKSKYRIIEVLLEASRFMLYSEKKEYVWGKNKIIVNIDKMNRLFFVSETKIYSFSFPFSIYYDDEQTKISYKNNEIDSFAISNLLSIIKSPVLESENCLDFVEPFIDFEDQRQINYWTIIRDLIILEDGYLRYDKDEKGYAKALEQNRQHKHPLYHIDVFYSNHVAFKLGLDKEHLDNDIIDLVDINTDCQYLRSAVGK